MTCLSWVSLHGIARSFSELLKPLRHDKAAIHEGEVTISYGNLYTPYLNNEGFGPYNYRVTWTPKRHLVQLLANAGNPQLYLLFYSVAHVWNAIQIQC